MKATMIRVLSTRGFGFARAEDGAEYYVHATDLVNEDDWTRIQKGRNIEFTVEKTEKGMRARSVTVC